MRDELGICYYVRASHDSYTDHGYFSISAGVANDRVEEAIKTIVEEVKKVKDEIVSAGEMKKVQAVTTGRLVMGHESSDSFADLYGFQELHHQPIDSLDAKLAKMKKITVKDIKKVAEKYCKAETVNLAIVGPNVDEKKLKEILRRI